MVSLPVLAYACGSDGAMSAMRVLIYPTGGLPRVPLQVCLSGADPLLTATTVAVRSINMFLKELILFQGPIKKKYVTGTSKSSAIQLVD